ncbi:Ig domain-containing protein [Clostridium sp. CTA-5]
MKNYFKKFSIMFVMLLALVGVGILQNVTVVNAATVGEQLSQPEDGWRRYDDGDSKIKYNGNWSNRYAPYKYENTDHFTRNVNDSATFAFYGSKLRILSQYASTNSDNIVISVDGVDTKVSTAFGSVTEYALLFEGEYSLGNHIVKITNYGNWYNLDAIDIDKDGHLINLNEAICNQSIILNKSSLSLKEGTLEKLTATTTPAGAKIVWSSSDENIAKVDENGNVTGVKEGQVTITAQIKGSETKAICSVTVSNTIDPNDGNANPTDNNDGTSNIVNIAHAKGDNTNNAGGQVSIIFKGVAEAQLKVVKTADVDSVYVGDTFTYTIEVTNTSDKVAKSVVINDSAPNHIDFIVNGVTTTQGKVDPSSTSKNIVVNVGDIPPSGKVTIKIPANVVL